jgi:glycosyltransferase involved in cell wall biosynthesis
MKITVCVPAYNEAKIIEQTLKTITDFCRSVPQHQWRIVVADNGSTDDTIKCAKRISNVFVIEVKTRGKGAAVVEAVKQSDSDIFCYIDADLSASPKSLPELIKLVERGTDIAIGSRLLDTSKLQRSFLRTFSSRLFNFFRKIVLGVDVTDTQCGLKALNKKGQAILASCVETGWFFDIELLAKAERAGLTVKEVAIPWQENFYPDRVSKLHVLRDGIKGVIAMLRIRYHISKHRLAPSVSLATLLIVAAITYFGIFFLHLSAVNSSDKSVEFLYYERGDSSGYVDMARSILNGDESLLAEDESARGLRTPGYPIFLAGVFTISDSPYFVIILQILIALATIPLIYQIALKLTNFRVAFLASLSYIIYPTTAFLNTQILSETLFMFFTTLSLWLLLTLPKHKTIEYVAIGATAGVATLIRPSFLYIIPFIIGYILISRDNIWQRIISGGIVAIAFFVILSPWIHANARDYNHPSLSTAGNFNILYYYIPQFLAQDVEIQHGWLTITEKLMNETKAAGYEIGSHNASAFEAEQIQNELAGQKIAYLFFHLKRSVLTLVTSGIKMLNNELTELGQPLFTATPWIIQHVYTYGISFDLIKNNLLAFTDAGMMALVTLLMPIGVIVGIWRRDKRIWGLLLIFSMIIITVLLAGPIGNARYRMPIQPYIFMLAFLSLQIIFHHLITLWQNFKHKSV